MDTKCENNSPEIREVYVQLARLAHDSFEQRRSYEWKMHFGLWAAIVSVVWAVIKKDITALPCSINADYIGWGVFVMYILHFILVCRGHWEDKKRKHFYMALAEGKSDVVIEELTKSYRFLQVLWSLPYLSLTGLLIYLAISILKGI